MNPNAKISEQPGGLGLQRAIGVLALVVGVALSGMLFVALMRAVVQAPPQPSPNAAYVSVAVLAALAAFFLSTGWRMTVNRPNRHDSLLPPSLWFVAGGLFLICSGFGVFHFVKSHDTRHWEAWVYAFLFALLSVTAGWRALQKSRPR